MNLEYFTKIIAEQESRRDYSKLPADFERDAVHHVFTRHMKDHFGKRDIAARIKASKAETFAELRQAVGL